MKNIRIGLAGFGPIGIVHLLAYRNIPLIYTGLLPPFEVVGVCQTSREKAEETARRENLERAYADFDEMVADPSIDIIDIVTPNYLHKDQVLKALRSGKHVLCEKPLALNGREADEIERVAAESECTFGMIFNYRFIPAIMKARQLIEAGRLGEIYTFRAEYYHTGYQNPEKPWSWRMDRERSGGGALMDLGVHVIDLVRYLLGEVDSIQCKTRTYIPQRFDPHSSRMEPVTVDDAAWAHINLKNGGVGTLEVSRFATGALEDLKITAYGSKGAFRFDLMDSDFLYWFDPDDEMAGWKRLETVPKYKDARTPNPRSTAGWIRYHTENQYRFLRSVVDNTTFLPDVHDGAMANHIIDAAYESANSSRDCKVADAAD
ncbi:MAG: Gfo/Idh/MocA family oxidoreductase [Spirochaetales bacterium]|nr:Gfo/Idh/MocA family oxidoreductase [Spirochaetales bacterium]